MKSKHWKGLATASLLMLTTQNILAHGLMSDPPSRNWLCGAVTKPDQAAQGGGEHPACRDAFAQDPNGGYQFMSVLTHSEGRAVVDPLPEHVCGFGSSTWQGGATPWDQPVEWPANPMSAGPQTITWNIAWGPHFDDTEEFRYWITREDFQFEEGRPLTWGDFEEEAFCVLDYDDSQPGANPNVVADKANQLFHTQCDVPPREGRHVIYGEWGRNQWTYERFHGCIDVSFEGAAQAVAPLAPRIALQPAVDEFVGDGSITLNASTSRDSGLSYQWSISSADDALYRLENADSASATLHLQDTEAAGRLTISLLVSDGKGSENVSVQLQHLPSTGVQWAGLGALTSLPRTFNEGDRLSVRAVREDGRDLYFPATPLTITAGLTAADAWPQALAEVVNKETDDLKIGVLNGYEPGGPMGHATENRIYARASSHIGSAYLEVAPAQDTMGPASCSVDYDIVNQWHGGMQVDVTLTNTGSQEINGYELAWNLGSGEAFVEGWNADFSASGANMVVSNAAGHWNATLAANGGSASFGFLVHKDGDSQPSVPGSFSLNGETCGNGPGGSHGGGDHNGHGGGDDSGHGGNHGGGSDNNQGGGDDSGDGGETPPGGGVVVPPAGGSTPVERWGQLRISGNRMVNARGDPVQLRGMSSHGLQWFGEYMNEDSIRWLKDDWKANVVRAAMYTESGGYMQDPSVKYKVIEIVDAAIALGKYVIIDWHILEDGDPNINKDAAIAFFEEMAHRYGDYPNIIYEIANEPNGDVNWDQHIRPYAEEVIPAIRAIDPNNIIIVGTGTWSQDIHHAADNPLHDDNLMYALHFYAGTHGDELRRRIDYALERNAPIFVTEWGVSQASGDGGVFEEQTRTWINFLNERQISWVNWNLSDKVESSAALAPGTDTRGGWDQSQLSDSGRLVRELMRAQ